MILGPPSPCFVEIDEAVAQLQAARGDDRPVVFHWQADVDAIPRGAILYNFDYPGVHFGLGAMRVAANRSDEVWDFSARGVAMWRAIGVDAKLVPVGYHPSMTRFDRRADPDIDVVFAGSMNARRAIVFTLLEKLGKNVAFASADRADRDALLARCRTSVNMLFYPDGVYPVLRGLHLAANGVPFVSEVAPEIPTFCPSVRADALVDAVARNVDEQRKGGVWPSMVLPS